MKIKLSLIIGVILCVLSCTNSNKVTYLDPKEFFSLTDTLKGEIISPPLNTICTFDYTEYGLLANVRTDNKIFRLLDSTDASVITSSVNKGRGPGELLMAMVMQYEYSSNLFSVLDLPKQELSTFSVSLDTISFIKSVSVKRDLQCVAYINDSTLVFISFYPHQKMGLINTAGELVYEEDYNMLRDSKIKTTDAYHSVRMHVSPSKKYTVIRGSHFPSIEVYLNKGDTLELHWQKMLFKPKYNYDSKKNWYKLKEDQYLGFGDFSITDNFIYLGCKNVRAIDELQNKPRNKYTYILVMDYEGNIVKQYLMDKYFEAFAVSPDGKSLYAMVDDPDLVIMKYSL